MPDGPHSESRFYLAIGMIGLPVVLVAVTSVMLGGRAPGQGIPPLLLGETICLAPVFLGGIVLALFGLFRDGNDDTSGR